MSDGIDGIKVRGRIFDRQDFERIEAFNRLSLTMLFATDDSIDRNFSRIKLAIERLAARANEYYPQLKSEDGSRISVADLRGALDAYSPTVRYGFVEAVRGVFLASADGPPITASHMLDVIETAAEKMKERL